MNVKKKKENVFKGRLIETGNKRNKKIKQIIKKEMGNEIALRTW